MKRMSARVRMVLALALGVPLAVAGTDGATAAPGGPSATHVQAAARSHGLPWRLPELTCGLALMLTRQMWLITNRVVYVNM
jgi:hypothetical protein